jgi:hypothetical protein
MLQAIEEIQQQALEELHLKKLVRQLNEKYQDRKFFIVNQVDGEYALWQKRHLVGLAGLVYTAEYQMLVTEIDFILRGKILIQQPPVLPPTTPCSVATSVANQVISRSKVGHQKYGNTLDRKDFTTQQWLQHLQEELLDAANYVEKLKRELPNDDTKQS